MENSRIILRGNLVRTMVTSYLKVPTNRIPSDIQAVVVGT